MNKIEKTAFIILSLCVLATAAYIIFAINKLPKQIQELDEARKLSRAALYFNIENFYTQLELWEFAYDPNDERLAAFQEHAANLDKLVKEFLFLSEEGQPGRYEDATFHAQKIISDFNQIKEDWKYVVPKIQNYQEAMTGELEAIAKEAVIGDELLFDRLEFSEEVKNFIEKQNEYIGRLELKMHWVVNSITAVSLIWFVIFIILILWALLDIFLFSKKHKSQ